MIILENNGWIKKKKKLPNLMSTVPNKLISTRQNQIEYTRQNNDKGKSIDFMKRLNSYIEECINLKRMKSCQNVYNEFDESKFNNLLDTMYKQVAIEKQITIIQKQFNQGESSIMTFIIQDDKDNSKQHFVKNYFSTPKFQEFLNSLNDDEIFKYTAKKNEINEISQTIYFEAPVFTLEDLIEFYRSIEFKDFPLKTILFNMIEIILYFLQKNQYLSSLDFSNFGFWNNSNNDQKYYLKYNDISLIINNRNQINKSNILLEQIKNIIVQFQKEFMMCKNMTLKDKQQDKIHKYQFQDIFDDFINYLQKNNSDIEIICLISYLFRSYYSNEEEVFDKIITTFYQQFKKHQKIFISFDKSFVVQNIKQTQQNDMIVYNFTSIQKELNFEIKDSMNLSYFQNFVRLYQLNQTHAQNNKLENYHFLKISKEIIYIFSVDNNIREKKDELKYLLNVIVDLQKNLYQKVTKIKDQDSKIFQIMEDVGHYKLFEIYKMQFVNNLYNQSNMDEQKHSKLMQDYQEIFEQKNLHTESQNETFCEQKQNYEKINNQTKDYSYTKIESQELKTQTLEESCLKKQRDEQKHSNLMQDYQEIFEQKKLHTESQNETFCEQKQNYEKINNQTQDYSYTKVENQELKTQSLDESCLKKQSSELIAQTADTLFYKKKTEYQDQNKPQDIKNPNKQKRKEEIEQKNDYEKKPNLFKLKHLGKGGFSEVQQYYDSRTGEIFAIKQFSQKWFYESEKNNYAILIQNNLKEYICKLINVDEINLRIHLETGILNLNEIKDILKQQNKEFPVRFLKDLLIFMISFICKLHQINYYHGDIKLSNIIIIPDSKYINNNDRFIKFKFIDFDTFSDDVDKYHNFTSQFYKCKDFINQKMTKEQVLLSEVQSACKVIFVLLSQDQREKIKYPCTYLTDQRKQLGLSKGNHYEINKILSFLYNFLLNKNEQYQSEGIKLDQLKKIFNEIIDEHYYYIGNSDFEYFGMIKENLKKQIKDFDNMKKQKDREYYTKRQNGALNYKKNFKNEINKFTTKSDKKQEKSQKIEEFIKQIEVIIFCYELEEQDLLDIQNVLLEGYFQDYLEQNEEAAWLQFAQINCLFYIYNKQDIFEKNLKRILDQNKQQKMDSSHLFNIFLKIYNEKKLNDDQIDKFRNDLQRVKLKEGDWLFIECILTFILISILQKKFYFLPDFNSLYQWQSFYSFKFQTFYFFSKLIYIFEYSQNNNLHYQINLQFGNFHKMYHNTLQIKQSQFIFEENNIQLYLMVLLNRINALSKIDDIKMFQFTKQKIRRLNLIFDFIDNQYQINKMYFDGFKQYQQNYERIAEKNCIDLVFYFLIQILEPLKNEIQSNYVPTSIRFTNQLIDKLIYEFLKININSEHQNVFNETFKEYKTKLKLIDSPQQQNS